CRANLKSLYILTQSIESAIVSHADLIGLIDLVDLEIVDMQSVSSARTDRSGEAAHIVIIGGGITGLSTAFYLQRQAQEAGVPLRYTLIEREARFGGKLVTDTVGPFVVEGGPDSILTQKPWGMQLVRDLGLEDQLIGINDLPRKVAFLAKG